MGSCRPNSEGRAEKKRQEGWRRAMDYLKELRSIYPNKGGVSLQRKCAGGRLQKKSKD